ncbi:MAG: hypothetical protein Q7T12_00575 [Flavobacterium sp.]|nr:hypothetical protein [Flavobacterium sp.]
MNKSVKIILYTLNVLIFGIAIYWFTNDKSPEPLITMIGQFLVLLTLIFESKIAKISIENVSDSEVDVETDSKDESSICISKIKKGSKVNVKRN